MNSFTSDSDGVENYGTRWGAERRRKQSGVSGSFGGRSVDDLYRGCRFRHMSLSHNHSPATSVASSY